MGALAVTAAPLPAGAQNPTYPDHLFAMEVAAVNWDSQDLLLIQGVNLNGVGVLKMLWFSHTQGAGALVSLFNYEMSAEDFTGPPPHVTISGPANVITTQNPFRHETVFSLTVSAVGPPNDVAIKIQTEGLFIPDFQPIAAGYAYVGPAPGD